MASYVKGGAAIQYLLRPGKQGQVIEELYIPIEYYAVGYWKKGRSQFDNKNRNAADYFKAQGSDFSFNPHEMTIVVDNVESAHNESLQEIHCDGTYLFILTHEDDGKPCSYMFKLHEIKISGMQLTLSGDSVKPEQLVGFDSSTTAINEKTHTVNSGEKPMSTSIRKPVTVIILDPSAGIEPTDSLIADLGTHIFDGDQGTLKLQLAMDPKTKLAKKLEEHNAKRAEIVDEDIRSRTGNEVMLRPLKIEEVEWSFK